LRSDCGPHDSRPDFGLLCREMDSSYKPDFLPPKSLTAPLWKRILVNTHDRFAAEPPPLALTSRPVNVGMILGDRIAMPWFRSVFTNIGDVISPETLPPLELQSQPEDLGELLGDQLSRPWYQSLIRSLADKIAPERLPALPLSSKPVEPVTSSSYLLAPQWSALLDVPKLFYPDKPKDSRPYYPAFNLTPAPAMATGAADDSARRQRIEYLTRQKKRAIKLARLREAVWVSCVLTEIVFLVIYFSH
jgi:hypothetical protein